MADKGDWIDDWLAKYSRRGEEPEDDRATAMIRDTLRKVQQVVEAQLGSVKELIQTDRRTIDQAMEVVRAITDMVEGLRRVVASQAETIDSLNRTVDAQARQLADLERRLQHIEQAKAQDGA